jgi:hypothetical protein
MPRHRRRHVWPFVRRDTYLDLRHRYEALLADYRALEADHESVLADHEGLLFNLEADGPPSLTDPLPPRAGRRVPSWARTEEIPVLAEDGLDPDKAASLVRRTGLLEDPSGAWG